MSATHPLLYVKSTRPHYKEPADVGVPLEEGSDNQEGNWDIIIVGGGSAGCVLASR